MQIPIEALPTDTRFFVDYVRDWPRVAPFFARPYSLDEIARFAGTVEPDPDRRGRLAAVVAAQQERWRVEPGPARRLAEGAVAVMTGQQAGLFTGPLFSVFKALTAVKTARALTDRGIDAVPVFWIAAEDHDRDEIEWAGLLERHGEFRKVTAELVSDPASPAGWMAFTEGIRETIRRSADALPPSEYRPELIGLLEDAYAPGVSPVDAFARFMGRLFRGTDLVFVDPLAPDFRGLAEDWMASAFERKDSVRSAVLERSRRISEAGYRAQVRVDNGFTGFFVYRGRSRRPVGLSETAPGASLSPNALLRPVLQDAVFPTAAFVAGPSEIAYLAQAGAVYERLGVAMPPILPRITATIVEPPAARAMRNYGLRIEDVFQGPEHVRRKAVRAGGDTDAFARARGRVVESIESLRPLVEGVEPTLGGAVDNALRKVRHQVDSLETRFVNASVRRDAVFERHLAAVSSRLFPGRRLQERVVNVTSFLARYGLDFVETLDRILELDPSAHQVVEP